MIIEYSSELQEFMRKKGYWSISVEVASSTRSDFEVTEIFCRYVRESYADYLLEKKGYRGVMTEMGRVLFPPYHLMYSDKIKFYLKKTWIFRQLSVEGISL